MKKYLGPAMVVALAVGFLAVNAVTPHLYRNLVGPFLAKLWHLALFGAMWLAAYFVGRALLYALRYRAGLPPELATAAGVVVFSVVSLVLGATHLAYAVVVKAVVIGVLAAGAYPWIRRLKEVPARLARWVTELGVGLTVWLFAGAVIAFPLVLAAAEPPIYWDALTYHLAVPHAYAVAHGFVYLPHNVYASMPLGATMFYMWAMLWDGLTCANASYLVVSLLVVALVYRLARVWLSRLYAGAAACLVFFSPVFFVVMPGAHVDHFLMLYALAALYVYFSAREGEGPYRRALTVGIFLGAALAIKYTSVYALGAFAPIWIYDLIRRRLRWRELFVILAVAFTFVVPWFVKAYVERGNPVFPLLYETFGGRDFSAEQVKRLIAWQHSMGAGRNWDDFLWLPYRVSVKADFDYGAFAGLYLPFLLPLAAAAAWLFRRAGRIVAFGWAFFAWWALGPQQLRFLDGGLGAMAIAAAGALAAGESLGGMRARRAWRAGVVVLMIFVGFAYNIGGVLHTREGFEYLAGQGREEFLMEKCGFYRAQKFLNEETPPEAKVLMVFTNHTLYLKREAVYDSFFEASAFLLAAEGGEEAAGLYRLAREWGITHVHVFHMFEKKVWPFYEKRTKNVFYEFIEKYTRQVYKDPLNDIYELAPAE